ncbi:MAG: Cell division protein FtsI [Peptidoglycan synthetase] [uncultured Rubrobacteraceae bacterium]|uniref:Cell division protein FtsI [Peptidoglycan synthetase] n=1 Tax=uncultured Rubrobacteraceae bacterium TaxID=349277 RepID=A0A6J4Q5W6_9ACTN|nr:MAG: Cell division protein FtsI [Peptidoglycan synthetase] [uncultured Rubrobacteraceae bacterium]
MRIVAAVFLVVGLLLGGRAIHIGLSDGDRYGAYASEIGVEHVAAAGATRGSIVSADGRELAKSLETATVIATPYLIEDPESAAKQLETVLGPAVGPKEGEILGSLSARGVSGEPSGYSEVATDVPPEAAGEVEDLGLAGIATSPDTSRIYPEGALASQLTGYQGEFGDTFGGVEARQNQRLGAGEDVRLTVDTAVQQQLEDALERTVEKHKAKSAIGLMMRVKDGAIVALANSPGYDNNDFGEAPPESQRDRVITDPYEPGSTFKAFTVASALDAGAVSTESTYVVPDRIAVADRVIHDSRHHETKIMKPVDVIRESSNVGAIQIAQALGGERLHDAILRFGFGERTGIDLWGEDPGVVPAYEDWSGSSIGNIPIGQGLTVTPLQLVAGYAALANGGRLVTPHVTEREVQPGPRVISEETSDIVGTMLQGVVSDGSGHLAQIPGYTVAGKTGTSQKVDPETGAYTTEYVSSFVGFVPASDPEFVMLVAVDEPQTTYWGELTAAPVFKDVMGFALGYYNVPPDALDGSGEATP